MLQVRLAAIGVLALTAALVAAADTQGHGPVTAASDAGRGAYFTLVGLYIAPLEAMGRGTLDYDATLAENAAMNLAMLAQLDQSSLWPATATSGIARPSLALPGAPSPEHRALDDMAASIIALAPVAATGVEPMRLALADVGQSCRSCHESYPEIR